MKKGWYYDVYLRSEHWLKTREIALENAGHKCSNPECGWKYGLNVHHLNYNPYNEEQSDLKVLCRPCHQKEHGLSVSEPSKAPTYFTYDYVCNKYPKRKCHCCGGTIGYSTKKYCNHCKQIKKTEDTICICHGKKLKKAKVCRKCNYIIKKYEIESDEHLRFWSKRRERNKKARDRAREKRAEAKEVAKKQQQEEMKRLEEWRKMYNLIASLDSIYDKTTEELRLEAEEELKLLIYQNEKLLKMVRDFNNS